LRERQSIENEVAAIFAHKLNVDVPSFDSDLFATGVLDSLRFVDLLFNLEQHFEVRIPFDSMDIDDFRSIERITVMLARQNGKSKGT